MDFKETLSAELIAKAQQGENAANEKLIRFFFPIIRNISHSYFIHGGDSDDIFQEGLIGLFGAIRSFDPAKSDDFVKYAKICAHRSIISAIKQANRKKHEPLNTYVDIDEKKSLSYDDLEYQVVIKEKLLSIYAIIDIELSVFEKQVLDLFVDGLSYREISELLGKDIKSIENALARIRSKLV